LNKGNDFIKDFEFLIVGRHTNVSLKALIDLNIINRFYEVNALDFNIEHYKTLLTFTAWYAIAKNAHMFKSDYVGLFEYDCEFKKDISELKSKLNDNTIIGFIERTTSEELYLPRIVNFVNLLPTKCIEKALQVPTWSATTNVIVPRKFLIDFVEWYEEFIPKLLQFKNHPHVHERAINIFAANNSYNVHCYPEYLRHIQLNSHNIDS
jgi:hypothetical protein